MLEYGLLIRYSWTMKLQRNYLNSLNPKKALIGFSGTTLPQRELFRNNFASGVAGARRQELLQWAQQQDAWVVEDDYDGEFQYGGAAQRVPALCSLPGSERVLYVGTFSKTLHPGLRLGFVVVPPALAMVSSVFGLVP